MVDDVDRREVGRANWRNNLRAGTRRPHEHTERYQEDSVTQLPKPFVTVCFAIDHILSLLARLGLLHQCGRPDQKIWSEAVPLS